MLAIIKRDNGTGTGVQELKPGEARAEIVLDHTPFYADAWGGQVGDVGWLWRRS